MWHKYLSQSWIIKDLMHIEIKFFFQKTKTISIHHFLYNIHVYAIAKNVCNQLLLCVVKFITKITLSCVFNEDVTLNNALGSYIGSDSNQILYSDYTLSLLECNQPQMREILMSREIIFISFWDLKQVCTPSRKDGETFYTVNFYLGKWFWSIQ